MLLRSTTTPPILGALTNNHISEAFRIDFVNKSMLLRSKTKPPNDYYTDYRLWPVAVATNKCLQCLTKTMYTVF